MAQELVADVVIVVFLYSWCEKEEGEKVGYGEQEEKVEEEEEEVEKKVGGGDNLGQFCMVMFHRYL